MQLAGRLLMGLQGGGVIIIGLYNSTLTVVYIAHLVFAGCILYCLVGSHFLALASTPKPEEGVPLPNCNSLGRGCPAPTLLLLQVT